MKKLVCIFLICVTLCSLVSCSNEVTEVKEENLSPAQKIITRIDEMRTSYGQFDEDKKNEKELISIEQAYEALSEDEKQQVSNYNKLKEARYDCDEFNLGELINNRAVAMARRSLKTPSSFELQSCSVSLYVDPTNEKFICYGAEALVSFSGTNDFGGRKDASDWFYFIIDENGKIEDYDGYDFDELMESKNATKIRFS